MKRKGEKIFAEVINYLILSAFVKTKEDDGILAWICTASPEKDHKLFSNGKRLQASSPHPGPIRHLWVESDLRRPKPAQDPKDLVPISHCRQTPQDNPLGPMSIR